MGCFLSGALLASFSPIIVTREERASDKLLTVSRVKAMELTKNPSIALKTANKTLVIIPIILVLIIIFPRISDSFNTSKLSFDIFSLLIIDLMD